MVKGYDCRTLAEQQHLDPIGSAHSQARNAERLTQEIAEERSAYSPEATELRIPQWPSGVSDAIDEVLRSTNPDQTSIKTVKYYSHGHTLVTRPSNNKYEEEMVLRFLTTSSSCSGCMGSGHVPPNKVLNAYISSTAEMVPRCGRGAC